MYNAVLNNLSKAAPKFLENSEAIFLPETVIFLHKKSLSKKWKFFFEKLPLFQQASLKKQARGKNAAARLSSSLNYRNGIFRQIYKMKGNLPLPLAFFLYTSQLHGFLHNFRDSQFQIQKYLSPKHSRLFATDCNCHSTISQIRSKNLFLIENFFLSEKRWRW